MESTPLLPTSTPPSVVRITDFLNSKPAALRPRHGSKLKTEFTSEQVESLQQTIKARRGSSLAGAVGNFTKGLMGAGILSIPYAFGEAGEYLSLVSAPIISVIVYITMMLLAKHEANEQYTGDRYNGPIVTYLDLGKAAHPILEYVTLFCVVAMQMCFCIGWIIVITNSILTIIPEFLSGYRFIPVLTVFPILLLLVWIRYLKQLVYTSYFGLAVYIFGVMGLSYYYGLPNIGNYTEKSHWNIMEFPLFMSTLVYALGGFNGVLSNESTLTDPKGGYRMVSIGLPVFAILVYLLGGLLNASGFGTCSLILDCLPNGVPTYCVKVLLAIALIFTFPLGFSYALDVVETRVFNEKTKLRSRLILRLCFLIAICTVGVLVPDFSLFSNFAGSLLLSMLGFVLPALLYLFIKPHTTLWQKIGLITIAVFGGVYLIIGFIAAIWKATGKF